jgi:hypothetical protein
LQLKVLAPSLLSRIEKPHHVPTLGVDAREVRTLKEMPPLTGEGEVGIVV